MFDELCSERILLQAWKTVKAKGSAGGVDGMSIEEMDGDIGSYIKSIQQQLKSGEWNPQPYLTIKIPKKNSEYRKLGLLSVKDKIVQQAIKTLIESRFEKVFLSNSYAYRPDKGHTKAVKFTLNIFRNKKYPYAVRLDIDNYFDNIDHKILFSRVKSIIPDSEILRLLELSTKMGMVSKKLKWEEIEKGVPQGAVLSPILANFYLNSFDQFVLSRDVKYVRYADDFIITCKTKEDAGKMLEEASAFLKDRLKLQLNTPAIVPVSEGVDFLGLNINDKRISLSAAKLSDLKERIKLLEWEGDSFLQSSVEKIEGIHRYYVPLLPEDILKELDMLLITRLEELVHANVDKIKGQTALNKTLLAIKFCSQTNILQAKRIRNQLVNLYSDLKQSKTALENNDKNKLLIKRRKIEYRQKEVEASELVVSNPGVFIGVTSKGITLKDYGKQHKMPPMANLKHITVLCSGVSISSNALAYCTQNGISIDYFSQTGQHVGSFLSQGLLSSTLWGKQAMMPLKKRSELASKIIYGKLKNQLNLIKYYHKYHKQTSDTLKEVYEDVVSRMLLLIKLVKEYKGVSDGYKSDIMGMEASGATLYWSYIKELLTDDDIGFLFRERKGATDLVNSMLNYGYSILYARIWRELLKRKLNPTDSVLHEPNNGKPTFVYDVIELFRCQAVDRVVISLVQKGEQLDIKKGLLTEETIKLLVANIIERLNKYETFRGENIKLLEIINRQVRDISLFIAEDEKFKPYIAKW